MNCFKKKRKSNLGLKKCNQQSKINCKLNVIFKKFDRTPIEPYNENIGEAIFEKVTQPRTTGKYSVSNHRNQNFINDEINTSLIIELLKLDHVDVNNIKNFLNQTLLHFASENNNLELCVHLLHYGADCLLEDNYRQSPFTISSKSNNLKLIELFCKFIRSNLKKDIEYQNKWLKQIRNSINYACYSGNVKIVQYLFDEFNFKSDMFLADKPENIFNKIPSFELNPLHVACYNANGNIVKFLLERSENTQDLINTPINDFRSSTTLEETFKGLLNLTSEEIHTNQYSIQFYRQNIPKTIMYQHVINLLIENKGKFSKNFIQDNGLSKLLAQTYVGQNKDIFFRHLLDTFCYLFKFKLNEIFFHDEHWYNFNLIEKSLSEVIKNETNLKNKHSQLESNCKLFDMEKTIDEFLLNMFVISQRVVKDHKRACMTKYIELLFILHYSGQFKIKMSKMDYLKEKYLALYNFIEENTKSPLSLKWLGIIQVRKTIGNLGVNKINSLQIPYSLKHNLFMNGIPIIDAIHNSFFTYHF